MNNKQLPLNFDIVKKFENSNVAVNELRTGIFAAIDKVTAKSTTYKNFIKNNKKRELETSWGKAIIKGNILTQTHRDLLDCIFANSKEIKELKGGSIAIYFSTSEVLDAYSGKNTRNTKWLKDKLDEIQTTAVEFRSKNSNEDFYSFNIISSVAYSSKHKSYGVVFTEEYRKFFEDQITVNYTKELSKLLMVDSSLLKAIIRFFWTHSSTSHMDILDLLKTIGYPMDSVRMIQIAIKEIKDNLEMLKDYGISYEPKTKLLYKKSDFANEIRFYGSIDKANKLSK